MYANSSNLRWKIPNCPQLAPAIALPVVPTMFGYSDITESAVLQAAMNIFSLSNFLILFL
jgi:Na+/citrate or Na+/malate symporter